MKRLDIAMSDRDSTRVALVDFGTKLDLRAIETDNCSVDNHALMRIFFVLCNWREIKYLNKRVEENDKKIANDCDEWVLFGVTISKGKKNNHVFHNSCLECAATFCDNERNQKNQPTIANSIVHAENVST